MGITRDLVEADRTIPANLTRNKIINGGFDIWQRGESGADGGYETADRWAFRSTSNVGGTVAYTKEEAISPTSTDSNYLRVNFNGATSYWYMRQHIEDPIRLHNKTLTASFKNRGFNISEDMKISLILEHTSGFTILDSGIVSVSSGTDNQVYSTTLEVGDISAYTFDISSNIFIQIETVNPPSNGDIRISQIQLEEGNRATPFEQRHIGHELALCQRYYWKGFLLGKGLSYNYSANTGLGNATTGNASFGQQMRVVPTVNVVTEPTYSNCSSYFLQASETGFSHRVTVAVNGVFRANEGIYEADAEI